jgi:hypothetical protein
MYSAFLKLFKSQTLVLSILCGFMMASHGQSGFKYPPTGKLVDAGGHMLHTHVMGNSSKNIVVKNSGHNIHLEDPAIVIHAIEQVISAYKIKAKLN